MSRFCLLLLLAVSLLTACASWRGQGQNGAAASNDGRVTTVLKPERANVYYDFDDILVPRDMELRPDKSLLFETPGVKAGLLAFEGRVEPVSLFDFFSANMPRDNWRLRSYFKYGRFILVFEKPERDCVISLDEGPLTTSLQIWVTPRHNTLSDGYGSPPK